MVLVAGADDVKHPPVLAEVASVKRIQKFLQILVTQVHRQAFGPAASDFLLALRDIPIREPFDLDRVVAQSFHDGAGKRHLDVVAKPSALTRLQGEDCCRRRQHGAIGRGQRQRGEGRVDAHEHPIEAHIRKNAGACRDDAFIGAQLTPFLVVRSKAGDGKRDQLRPFLPER